MSEDLQTFLGMIVFAVVVGIGAGVYYVAESILHALGLPWDAAPLLVVGAIVGLFALKWAIIHPREAALALTSPIWFPHFAVAWIILEIARCKMVRWWAYETDHEKEAVQVWLQGIPGLVTVGWTIAIAISLFSYWVKSEYRITWIILPTCILPAVLSGLLWLYCYYYIYFELPPKALDWVQFAGVHRTMVLERSLKSITSATKHKLQWRRLKHNLWGRKQS